MNPARLSGRPMELADVDLLGPRIREADRLDCATYDCNATEALRDGFTAGRAWTALWNHPEGEPEELGCFGWTREGNLWSLWTDLSREQSLALMSRAPAVIKGMAREAGEAGILSLWNSIRVDNHLTLAWLRATHCFNFGAEQLLYKGHRYVAIFVKPLGEL